MRRRVAVTGLGVVSAIGSAIDTFTESVRCGRSGIAPLQLPVELDLRSRLGAQVAEFRWGTDRDGDVYDRFALMAGAAAEQAIEAAGGITADAAVVTGSCLGGNHFEDASFHQFYAERRSRFHPLTVPRIMENAPASLISMRWGLRGPAYTVSSACASSSHAIGQAYWLVRDGVAEAAVTGGSDATFSPGILKAWEAMRVVSPTGCRPFSADRDGMILGEGAAMLVLEPLDAARARGAAILGEIVGFGMSADASHITQPSGDGAARAMRAALADAGLGPSAIGYVNAHGTGTPANDGVECKAIQQVLGDRVPVSSTKALHGHTLGAAGAIEAVATLVAMRQGFLPATAGVTSVDPDCAGDIIIGEARRAQVECALSNSFAFGGLNAVLVLRRPE